MPRFINTLNGSVIDVENEVSGKYWKPFEGVVEEKEETVEEVTVQEVPEVEEQSEEFDLTKMTIAELKDYAKENDIELSSDVTKKDEIIQVISEAFEG